MQNLIPHSMTHIPSPDDPIIRFFCMIFILRNSPILLPRAPLPLNQLVTAELPWGTDEHVTVLCRSGYRANLAASELLRRGYQNVYCLLGGMTAWQADS